MQVQTRSEKNGIKYHNSLKDAYNAWVKDRTIWKISFEGMKYRPITKGEKGSKEFEDKLCSLSESYKNEKNPHVYYWMKQSVLLDDALLQKLVKNPDYTAEQFSNLYDIHTIQSLMTYEEFQNLL